jgi:hypothetical protein
LTCRRSEKGLLPPWSLVILHPPLIELESPTLGTIDITTVFSLPLELSSTLNTQEIGLWLTSKYNLTFFCMKTA